MIIPLASLASLFFVLGMIGYACALPDDWGFAKKFAAVVLIPLTSSLLAILWLKIFQII